MPRSGLAAADVVRAGAEIADELGYHRLALGLLAQRLGIRSPSLYKHVSGLGDLQHRIAATWPPLALSSPVLATLC
jgi:AcrR family transcriptional regulator